MTGDDSQVYDVFMSHAHADAEIVEKLGLLLEDDSNFTVWLDRWKLIPGKHWQQEITKGLNKAKTCAVCIGVQTPKGWFREEIERALNRQANDEKFRVIPVILPGGDTSLLDDFLDLRTWVKFKNDITDKRAIHLLVSGIKGIPPGRFPDKTDDFDQKIILTRENLTRIALLRKDELIDDIVAIEFQRKILDQIIILERRK